MFMVYRIFHQTFIVGYRRLLDRCFLLAENLCKHESCFDLDNDGTAKEMDTFADQLGYSRYISVTELERGDYSPSGPAQRLLDMLEREADRRESQAKE